MQNIKATRSYSTVTLKPCQAKARNNIANAHSIGGLFGFLTHLSLNIFQLSDHYEIIRAATMHNKPNGIEELLKRHNILNDGWNGKFAKKPMLNSLAKKLLDFSQWLNKFEIRQILLEEDVYIVDSSGNNVLVSPDIIIATYDDAGNDLVLAIEVKTGDIGDFKQDKQKLYIKAAQQLLGCDNVKLHCAKLPLKASVPFTISTIPV